MDIIFNSRSTRYRSPFGACEEGTAVLFRISIPRNLCCRGAFISVKTSKVFREVEEKSYTFGMFWAGMNGDDHEWWECHFTPESMGVYWYRFELDTDCGKRFLWKNQNATACISEKRNGRCWQLTCFKKDFKTPDWLAGGVMYQIFPDRFAFSGEKKSNIPYGRIIRENWGDEPIWRPDSDGKIRNNDFFCGDIKGIENRLDYLKSLGVTCIYLNPIFEAQSSHRYDTADYSKIDPLLGDESDFNALIKSADEIGIKVILDGVFSHTGSDSVYFNKEGRYDSLGAFQSTESPYYNWYSFKNWPNDYKSWWGFLTLPEVNKDCEAFEEYINGEKGVVRKRISDGIGGWRLDVADELPNSFIDKLSVAAKTENQESILIGEVWEDASHKQGYGKTRRYLLGGQFDSVMNYPFRNAILELLCRKCPKNLEWGQASGGEKFFNEVMEIIENYPPQVIRLLMNHIGTHDTERAMTVLVGEPLGGRDREWQHREQLSTEQRLIGVQLMKLASLIQFMLPGVPCIYYGDEVGMSGYRDPFNRNCYPYGMENQELLRWYRRLGKLRKTCKTLAEGDFVPVYFDQDVIVFERSDKHGRLLCAVNSGDKRQKIKLDEFWANGTICIGGGSIDKACNLILPALECAVCDCPEI